jgi:hypothetical protein
MQPASALDSRWPDLVAAISAAIDLEATARSSGALVRRRGIRDAAALLVRTMVRTALAYGPGGLSLRAAAAWAGVSGLADLSDTAVMQRVRKAADWLGEIAGALVRRATAAPGAAPGALPGRRLRVRGTASDAFGSRMAASSHGPAARGWIGACTPPTTRQPDASARSR